MYGLIAEYYVCLLIARGPDRDVDLGPDQLKPLRERLAAVPGKTDESWKLRGEILREFVKSFQYDMSGDPTNGDIVRIVQ